MMFRSRNISAFVLAIGFAASCGMAVVQPTKSAQPATTPKAPSTQPTTPTKPTTPAPKTERESTKPGADKEAPKAAATDAARLAHLAGEWKGGTRLGVGGAVGPAG